MRIFVCLSLLSCSLAPAQVEKFNGRWDIRVSNESRGRAWWLQVEGAGTPGLKGKFVGFPGGDMNDIVGLRIENGVLAFNFDRQGFKKGDPPIHQEYRARLAGDKLEGTFVSGKEKLTWTGVRAPEINDKDDGSWREGKPIQLFNGKDLNAWYGSKGNRELGWTVENGSLKSTGGARNLETEAKYWNFTLHAEFKMYPHSNSGIGLRGRYEVQVLDDYGRPPDTHSNGALYSRKPPSENASKRAGEWQTYDIRLIGRQVTVVLNGKKVIDRFTIDGLTAIADNADEAEPGPIVLQGDHGPVEYRNLILTPFVKK